MTLNESVESIVLWAYLSYHLHVVKRRSYKPIKLIRIN